jgi:hypothetical protein
MENRLSLYSKDIDKYNKGIIIGCVFDSIALINIIKTLFPQFEFLIFMCKVKNNTLIRAREQICSHVYVIKYRKNYDMFIFKQWLEIQSLFEKETIFFIGMFYKKNLFLFNLILKPLLPFCYYLLDLLNLINMLKYSFIRKIFKIINANFYSINQIRTQT